VTLAGMGNVDKLLESLAHRLPPATDKATLRAVLQAARAALPKKMGKTKEQLSNMEDACIASLAQRIKQGGGSNTVSVVAEEAGRLGHASVALAASSSGTDATSANTNDVDAKAEEAAAIGLYADVDEDDIEACLARCIELLTKALMNLRPAERALRAIEGLMALLPPEHTAAELEGDAMACFSLDLLRSGARMASLASALTEGSAIGEKLAWRRLMGFFVAMPARLSKDSFGVKDSTLHSCREAAQHLGGIVALAGQPESARAALRIALPWLGKTPDASALACVWSTSLPVARVGLSGAALSRASLKRGDIVALLLLAQLLRLCRAQGVGHDHEHEELQGMLRSALEHSVDTAPMLPQLQKLTQRVPGQRGKALQRQLAVPRRSLGCAGMAAAVLQVMEAVPIGSLSAASITKLAAACGLPLDEDERVDQRLEAARARGSLFFEDVEGLVPDEADLEVAEEQSKEGVEGKEGKKRRKNNFDGEEPSVTKKSRKKRRHK